MTHRLAAGIHGFETRVIALDSPGAKRFDGGSALEVERIGASGLPRAGRSMLLNGAAVRHALRFRPDVTLSAHIVASPAAAVIRRAVGARTVQYFHAEEIGAKPKLAAFAARHADAVIAVSAYTAGLIADTGVLPASMSLISPGVDVPSDAAPEAVDRPSVLTIARLEERYKGHDVLVRALPLVQAKIPDVQWIVIGDGSLRPGLEHLARSYGVANATCFLGAVSDEQRDTWLRRAQLLAMPSRLPAGRFAGEGFGISFLEAGAYGKPVVAGNVAGALDAVLDGDSGLLVDPTDAVAVADAISRLLLDPALARRLGEGGAQRARSLAWPVVCERVEAVLRDQLP